MRGQCEYPIAVIALTVHGRRLAARIASVLDAEMPTVEGGIKATMARYWGRYRGFILVMAAGVAVRAVAPLLVDKRHDPAVVVMDEGGRFAISLIAGHLGGANALARQAAAASGGTAVITTASDVSGHTALDLWLRDHGLEAEAKTVTRASAILVNKGVLRVCDQVGFTLPPDFQRTDQAAGADLLMSWKTKDAGEMTAWPQVLFIGVGCNRGTPAAEFETALAGLLRRHGLLRQAIGGLASIDLKKNEAGLLAFAGENNWPLKFYHKDQLNRIPVAEPSAVVIRATGAAGVAEPAALIAAGYGKLIVRKNKWRNVTMAVACSELSAPGPEIKNT
jgi:cobalt-precorrin 5A hydrolase